MAAAGPSAERQEETGRPQRIVIELPRIDPKLRDLFLDMMPGRALLRVLTNPPEDFAQHARNARRERLLALRSLLDAMIDDTERPPSHARAREVEIE